MGLQYIILKISIPLYSLFYDFTIGYIICDGLKNIADIFIHYAVLKTLTLVRANVSVVDLSRADKYPGKLYPLKSSFSRSILSQTCQ